MAEAKFTVDTHLFRELGELLVGRDSTALVELIKNAYDADATKVVIHGHSLANPESGRITISDNGNGMTPTQFQNGFLRVASRFKDVGEKRSPKYKRRFTGAKGIGRLAAHKLARRLNILSFPSASNPEGASSGVNAVIEWDKIEELQTLDQVESSGAVRVVDAAELPIVDRATRVELGKPGTIIELTKLRKGWSEAERAAFFAEVQTYTAPDVLIELAPGLLSSKLVFERARVSDTKTRENPFAIELTGDFKGGEEYWQNLAHNAQWVVEVEARAQDASVTVGIAPTRKGREGFPDARRRTFEIEHPDPETGLSFQARVLVREGAGGNASEKRWLGRTSGIRVFMEGFRVLPYGEPNDDWLSLDADYKRRSKTLPLLENLEGAGAEVDEKEGLVFLGNQSYYGAIFLTQINAPTLKMLVNREGFVPDRGFSAVVDIMRKAIYLSVRVRAAAKQETREERSVERQAAAASRMDLRQAVEDSVRRASSLAQEARKFAAAGNLQQAEAKISEAAAQFIRGSSASERLMSEGAILRVLASVGMQMASFVHEINGLLGSTVALESALSRLQGDPGLSHQMRRKLSQLQVSIGELRRSVERQASYLTDVISPDARRRRSRQRLAERFDAACKLIQDAASRKGIEITNGIPPELKSPAMFPAELALVFTNLLTNAVKASDLNGRILATAVAKDDRVFVKIENTGVKVSLDEAERWFKPFESTTESPDPVLGQGMGMGLPITRNMLEEYGATIRFVKPSTGYSTALEVVFPA